MASRADNVDKQSLRGFLQMVEADYPRRAPAHPRGGRPAARHDDRWCLNWSAPAKNPVVIFDSPGRSTSPSSPTWRPTADCWRPASASNRSQLPTAFRERCQKYIPCELVSEAAWNEVVIEGDDVDLTKLPIPLQFAVDAAPYITAGQIAARDPVTGVDTTGFHRLDAQGQEPPRRLAAFAPAHVRVPPARGRARPRRCRR